eukprot:jgi/Mesvir1/1287/Mv03755-RA.1
MALTEKAKKRWIDKFNRLREERDSRYADQAHRRFCEAEGNASYDRVPVFETGVSQLEFPRLGWLLYHRSFMILAYPPKWESETLEIKTFRHDLLDPVFQTMPGYVRGDIPDLIDMKWYGDCLEYLRGLSPLQLILLHDYARDGYKYTNSQGWNVVETDRIIEVQDEERRSRSTSTRRSGDPNVALVVDNRLKGELVNMAGWKEVIAMIAKLDERLMDIIFLLSKWACKYLHLTFIQEHVLKEYAREMFAILQEAPVINREMIVYRGVTEDYYMPARGRRDVYKNTFPISVSVDPAVAINFLFNRICVFDKDHEIAGDGSWRGPAGEPCAGRVDVESSNIPLIVDGPGVMTAFLDYREVKGFLLRRPFFDIVVLDPAIFLKNGEFKAFDYAVLATVIHLDRWKVEYKCTLFAVMRRQGYLGHYPGSRATRTNRCMELARQWIFASRGRVEIRGARNVVLGSGDKGSLEDQIHGLANGHGKIRFFFPESTSLFTTSDMISELLEDRLAEGTRCKLVLYKTANQPRPFMEKCEKIFSSIVLVGFTDVDLHHPSTKVALIPVGERPSKVTVYLGGKAGSVFTIYYCGYEVLRNTLSRRGKEAFNMVPINKAIAGDWGAHFPLILKYWFV